MLIALIPDIDTSEMMGIMAKAFTSRDVMSRPLSEILSDAKVFAGNYCMTSAYPCVV